jgi:uncharacterized NAD(P)/FAD-binding protein YdhS
VRAALRFDLAILGAGFSGAALAYHLARRAPPGHAIALVDPSPATGLGRAYDEPTGQLLLNVPAARMSLDPAAPLDFAAWWARECGTAVEAIAADFAPRRDYGRYVAARFGEALASAEAEIVRIVAGARDVEPIATGFRRARSCWRSGTGRRCCRPGSIARPSAGASSIRSRPARSLRCRPTPTCWSSAPGSPRSMR